MIEERLRDVGPAPGEAEARARAWELATAAAAGLPVPRRRRAPIAIVAAIAAALVAATSFTAPGAAVADWLRDRVRDAVGPAPTPVRGDRLPGGGQLLASSKGGPVVVGAGAPARLFGDVDEATWSPHARFVAVTRGIELIAIDRHGHRRWSLHHGEPILHPRWAPTGFRVAYLSSGTLWIVNGDGTQDHHVGLAGAAPPAWRPGHRHQLAYADANGRVVLLQADTGRVLWRTRPHRPPRALAFSADGSRLLVLARDRSYLLTAIGDGALLRQGRAPAGTRNVAAAFARHGRAYAVVREARTGVSRVVLVSGDRERLLLAVPGPVRGLAWSPDGRWLAVGARRADAWLLLRVRGGRLAGVRTLDRARARFGSGHAVTLEGWCCPA